MASGGVLLVSGPIIPEAQALSYPFSTPRPVSSVPNGQPQTELRVAGIVANYPTPLREPIVDKLGNPIVDDHNQPAAFFSENPGFVVAMAISHATDLIDANPVGFQLPTK